MKRGLQIPDRKACPDPVVPGGDELLLVSAASLQWYGKCHWVIRASRLTRLTSHQDVFSQ